MRRMPILLLALLLGAAPPPRPEPPGPQPTPAVLARFAEAEQMVGEHRLPEALAAAEKALLAARAAGDAVGEQWSHGGRARILEQLQRPAEAVAAWKDAAATAKRAGNGPGQAQAWAEAGRLLIPLRPEEADGLILRAVAVARAETRRPHAAAEQLDAAGLTCYNQSRLAPARACWEAALFLFRQRTPDPKSEAACLNNLGAVAVAQGDLTAARRYYEESLVLKRQDDPAGLGVATTLNNLGNVAYQQGDLRAARSYYQASLALKKQRNAAPISVASSLLNLGNVANDQGDPETAESFYRRALAIAEKADRNASLVDFCLYNLGTLAYARGDLEAAGDYQRRALALRLKRAPRSLEVAENRNSLGIIALDQGDLAAAEAEYRQALALYQEQAPRSLGMAVTLSRLGDVAYERERLEEAGRSYRQALALREELAPASLDRARSLVAVGNVQALQGDPRGARAAYLRALALYERLAPASLELARSYANLSEIARRLGERPEAERLARRGWEMVRRQGALVTGDEARMAFGAANASFAVTLAGAQLALGKREAALATVEEGRARALLLQMLERNLRFGSGGKRWDAYRASLKARDRAMQAVSQTGTAEILARRARATARERAVVSEAPAQRQTAATAAFAAARSAYTQARLQTDRLWTEIVKNDPRVRAQPLAPAAIGRALPPDSLLVEFAVGERETFLFLRRAGSGARSRLTVQRLPLTARQVTALVALGRPLADPGASVAEAAVVGRALFRQFFPPAARAEIAAAPRLLLSPDGALWELPFAALVTNAQGPPRYLGIEKRLTYTPSLTLFAQSRRSGPRRAARSRLRALVVGDPRFPSGAKPVATAALPASQRERAALFRGGAGLVPLPGTRREALRIARLYHTSPLLGEQATEAAVRRRIGGADVIHLGTHGAFHPTLPLSSGLWLAAANGAASGATDNDGLLQAWEIAEQLRLRAALVVLSACETGQGQLVRGEGVVGLTRALQYAGARAVVAARWRVQDASTATLMETFHHSLRQGSFKDEALRLAMAHAQQNPDTAAPYYWAAFFLTGDPERLPSSNNRLIGRRSTNHREQ